jgi:uncharacterized protein YbjT (DUF2867 family)
MAVGRSALLVGATGLVGSHVLRRLLVHPDYARVTLWLRRELAVQHPKLVQSIVDFERLQQYAASLDAQDVFVTLGTTIKKAGSQQAFYRVDYNYPFQVAHLAQQRGAQRFLMVSAVDANPGSRVFYSRVKGEAEEAIGALGLPSVWFFRPSLLLGKRAELRRGERIGEGVGRLIAPLLIGRLRKYRPIAADAVAAAMVYVATHDSPPPGAIESDEIARLAAGS